MGDYIGKAISKDKVEMFPVGSHGATVILQEKQIKSLETKLQIATEALEHYGSEKNWAHSNFDEEGFYADEYMVYRHGYSKAREALEKIGGGDEPYKKTGRLTEELVKKAEGKNV